VPRQRAPIHEGFKPPDLEVVVAKAAANPQARNVGDLLCDRPRREQEHGPAAHRQFSALPESLVNQPLVTRDDGVAHRPDAVRIIKLASLPQVLHLLLERQRRDVALDQAQRGSAEQHSAGCAIGGVLNRACGGSGVSRVIPARRRARELAAPSCPPSTLN
jgi:hypothetical protein